MCRQGPRTAAFSADGTVAKVKIDFDVLEKLSETSRLQYGLSGAVQHGASTLPDEAFDRFATGTAEIHLATGFQNMIFDSSDFLGELRAKADDYFESNMKNEWKEKDTEEQFIYKTRKKAAGPVQRNCGICRRMFEAGSAMYWSASLPFCLKN